MPTETPADRAKRLKLGFDIVTNYVQILGEEHIYGCGISRNIEGEYVIEVYAAPGPEAYEQFPSQINGVPLRVIEWVDVRAIND